MCRTCAGSESPNGVLATSRHNRQCSRQLTTLGLRVPLVPLLRVVRFPSKCEDQSEMLLVLAITPGHGRRGAPLVADQTLSCQRGYSQRESLFP